MSHLIVWNLSRSLDSRYCESVGRSSDVSWARLAVDCSEGFVQAIKRHARLVQLLESRVLLEKQKLNAVESIGLVGAVGIEPAS